MTKMVSVGTIKQFNPDNESFTWYIERVQLFIVANNIPNGKHVPVLLSVIEAQTYSLLRNLISPSLPKDKSFDEIVEDLKKHYEPKPIVIMERFYFHRRNQAIDESIVEFVAQLKKLSTHSYEVPRVQRSCSIHSTTTPKVWEK